MLSGQTLPAGTEIEIKKVLRCRDCILDFKPRVELEVVIDRLQLSVTAPIRIDLEYLDGADAIFHLDDRSSFLENSPHNQPLQMDEPSAWAVKTCAALAPLPFGLRNGQLVRPRGGRLTLAETS